MIELQVGLMDAEKYLSKKPAEDPHKPHQLPGQTILHLYLLAVGESTLIHTVSSC